VNHWISTPLLESLKSNDLADSNLGFICNLVLEFWDLKEIIIEIEGMKILL
jgi:hypothetical protein